VLCEFVGACRRVTAPPLAIAYLNLLRALCNSGESAHAFFGLLLKR
jgi:hypothetical protein